MKTLLVAVDNSDATQYVLTLAAEQARALQAQVLAVCCIDAGYALTVNGDEQGGEDPADFAYANDEQQAAEAVVRQALAVLSEAGVSASGKVLVGEAAEAIVAEAKAQKAAMIVMGRRQMSSFNRLLKGSCSVAVVEHAPCPVLIDVRADG
ncbi:universal stress protein UspA-like protein [Serratia sp. FGI94]|uniref:universal stress protein n=1 Tax=Serratia sp. FGI94 TaxID=671990 RepID=UPI0002A73719|nr:universal stress protein [Serratia sp. FGI94]AGB83203.1 universal stress protein UspA-like protein [Serratia sp. FGI94]